MYVAIFIELDGLFRFSQVLALIPVFLAISYLSIIVTEGSFPYKVYFYIWGLFEDTKVYVVSSVRCRAFFMLL